MSNQPRTAARKHKLNSAQEQAVVDWLVKEKLTYAQAAARLLEKFGVKLALSGFSELYRRKVQPVRKSKCLDLEMEIILPAIILPPVRVKVREVNGILVIKGAESTARPGKSKPEKPK